MIKNRSELQGDSFLPWLVALVGLDDGTFVVKPLVGLGTPAKEVLEGVPVPFCTTNEHP